MPLLPRLTSFARNLFRRAEVERELDEELQSYVELLAEEKTREGLSPAEAHRRALIELGGREQVKESVRERRMGQAVESFVQDLRYGFRMLARSPAFTSLAMVTLGLGVAASTAVFSVVDGVLLRALPYPEPERLVFVAANARDGRRNFSPPDFLDFEDQMRSFEGLAALRGQSLVTLTGGSDPVPVRMREVTSGFLDVYGVRPYLGRGFTVADEDVVAFEALGDAEETAPTGVVLISYELWRDRFGSDPSAVGKIVEIDLQPYQIVGVAPPRFRTLIPDEGDYTQKVDVWALTRMDFRRMPRDASFLRVVGRLKPGMAPSEARAEASLFAERQRKRHALHREAGFEATVLSLHRSLSGRHAKSLWMLFAAVGFLLLIVCANLVNLLLTRAVARERELALRLALGSGRLRLVRQLWTESLLYALGGTALALPLAQGLVRAFVGLAPSSIPRMQEVGIDGRVVGFALGAAVVATSLALLVPVLRVSRQRSLGAPARGTVGDRHPLWDRALVVGEVALSLILVIATALLLRSLFTLLRVDPGFEPERVLTAEMHLSSRRYPRYPRPDARVRLTRRVVEGIEALPGVDVAALALVVPLSGEDAGHTYATVDMAASRPVSPPAKYRPVTPGYFRAVGTRLLSGRDFTWDELEEYRLVSIVDESLAERAWPGEEPIGKRLRIEVWSTEGGGIHLEPLWTEVIGVAENVRSTELRGDDPETVYLPYGLYAHSELSLLVHTMSEPSALTAPIGERVRQIDPDLVVFNYRVMNEIVADAVAPERFSADLLGAFGVTGLALALVGLYGVLSHAVSLRRREIGVRMALGARPRDVLGHFLTRGAVLIGAGVALGLAGASGLAHLIAAELHGVSPFDGEVYAVVASTVLVASLAACYLPARRAARIDPVRSLRLE